MEKARGDLSLETRKRLACFGDDSMAASAIRLQAARFVVGVSVFEIPDRRWGEPTIEHIEAAEAGKVLPNARLQWFYWRRLKLTANFFDGGAVHQIPIEIERLLFAALKDIGKRGSD